MTRTGSRPKKHHFVPRWYLERFTDRDGFLHILDRPSKTLRRQRPEAVMKINAYYRQDWVPAGTDPDVLEKTLGSWLEPKARNATARLVADLHSIDDDDIATLISYLQMQRIRVPRQLEHLKVLMQEALEKRAPSEMQEAIRSGTMRIKVYDSARIEIMRILLGAFSDWFACMEWDIVTAATGSAFVSSDSPVSFHNEGVSPQIEPGIAMVGTRVLFPLDPRHVLILTHSPYTKKPSPSPTMLLPPPPREDGNIAMHFSLTWNAQTVESFNRTLTRLSDRLVVANDPSPDIS
ncbi:MAG: DUF4238 domain-containing protein [Burkholderiales bacterium]|nr:DUF4238 domain-containing protein [Burkholderiales bacterium]